ncbi:MAG: flippase-like domain-containing protein [Chloroflexi bacterium]|nr:flippase-like domain-containing protein [Chloroflexota bacterium]
MEIRPQPQNILSRLLIRWKDILKIILALALIGFVLAQTNFQQIIALKGQIVWQWLWLSLILFCLMTVVKAMQYHVLLDANIPYRQVLKIVVIQNALSNLVGNSIGIASYLTMFRIEQNVKLSRSGIVFVLTKAGDLFAIVFFLGLSSWMVWERVAVLRHMIVILLMSIFIGLIIFWTAILLRQRFVYPLERLLYWLHLGQIPMVRRGMELLRSLVDQDHRSVVRALCSGLALSLFYMTITMASFYSKIQIFQIPIDFWPIILIATLMQLISLVPIQVFGGLGVNELSSIYLYDLFGVVQVDIPAILIGLRIFFYLFNLVALAFVPLVELLDRMQKNKNSE